MFTIRVARGSKANHRLLPGGVSWKNLRVLVVDDSPEVLEYFQSIADALHISCRGALSGAEACRVIEESRDNPFHIAFVDWKMPDTNGIELAHRITGGIDKNMIVIMISANEWSSIEKEAREAGVVKFLSKPLFPSLIADCINELLGRTGNELPEPESGELEEGFFMGKRILLAEDIEINREIAASLLEHTGVSIDSAENGLIAYELFKNNPGAYDLVLMDIHMPEQDGYETTRRIRALEKETGAAPIPIVAMTANVFREDVERCLAAGMNDHLGKPLDNDELLGKLRKYLLG